ncbi:hypothetical protein ACHAXR_001341, partial [Thalassiosira sp. AJA248-18]
RLETKAGKLTDDRIKLFTTISGMSNFQHCNATRTIMIHSDDPKLAQWVRQQRLDAKSGKLTNDRMKCLESIGFVDDNEHGNCLVPRGFSDDPKLARWVNLQRKVAKVGKLTDYRRKRLDTGKVTNDQRKRSESIGFVVEVQDYWDEQFADCNATRTSMATVWCQ